MPPILITGAEGQLGREFARQLGASAHALSRADLDITDAAAVDYVIRKSRPRAVINCAAYTAVDRAETDKASALAVNVTAVENLAAACAAADSVLVQISTDYVFGGDPGRTVPYAEDDAPAPQSVYALTKLQGEAAAAASPKHLIVRTCGLYGKLTAGHGGNFVETMLRVGPQRGRVRVVNDQRGTPSYVADVAQATLWLLEQHAMGLFHVVNHGSATWCEFAREVFRLADPSVEVEPITTAEFGAAAKRPGYSVLSTEKYERLGGPVLRPWQEALAVYLSTRA